MDRQLKRLETYLQYSDQHGQRIQTINLLVQKNVPVTYMADSIVADKPADSPATAATPSPSPSSKPATNGKDKKNGGKDKKGGAPEKKSDAKPPSAASPHKDHASQPFLKPATRVTPAGVQ